MPERPKAAEAAPVGSEDAVGDAPAAGTPEAAEELPPVAAAEAAVDGISRVAVLMEEVATAETDLVGAGGGKEGGSIRSGHRVRRSKENAREGS